MKNWKRVFALLLCLALAVSLCACGDPQADGSGSPSAGPSQDHSAAPTIEVDLTQDAVAFSTGLAPTDVLLTVNGETIPADLFLYWLFSSCYYLDYNYYYYYGITIDLGLLADDLLDNTVDMAAYYTMVRQRAAELGCLPTDAQMQEARDDMLADGQEYYDSLRTAYGLSEESMTYLTTISYYHDNLLDALFPTATEEMLNSYVYQVKHILLMTIDEDTGETLDEETVAAQRAQAEDILARLQAVEGEELTELFDELMNEYSEDGRDKNGDLYAPDGYTAVPGDMVTEFEEASLALPIGGLSGIVESTYGFHIILRGEVEDIEDYAYNCRAYHLDLELEALLDAADIIRAGALADIDMNDFYDRYIAYQNAVMDAYYASVEGGDSGDGDGAE